MDCTEFVARFSEYLDGAGAEDVLREAVEHEASCPSCARYRRVVEEGRALLRELPGLAVRDDFRPRLQHRLYHVDYEASLRRRASSGTTALTTLGMALLLVVAAWSPTLWREPVVQLDPILVTKPAREARPAAFSQASAGLLTPPSRLQGRKNGFWADAHDLLFEYSPVHRRHQGPPPVRGPEQGGSP